MSDKSQEAAQIVLEESDNNVIIKEEIDAPTAMSMASVYQKASERIHAVKRPSKKKPKDKPKRPLSAYNFFFKTERGKILAVLAELDEENKEVATDGGSKKVVNDPNDPDYIDEETVSRLKKEGGKVSFEEMGKIIGQRWKNIDPDRLQKFSELAAEDTDRYKKEMQTYNGRQEEKMRTEAIMKPVMPTYPDMHLNMRSAAGTGAVSSYSDPSMGYEYTAPGGYYGYPEAYPYPSGMYPYSYPPESMPQQQMSGPQPPDTRSSQQQQYSQSSSGYYGIPPGYPMSYGSGSIDAYGQQPPQGMDYPYGSGYGGWGPQ